MGFPNSFYLAIGNYIINKKVLTENQFKSLIERDVIKNIVYNYYEIAATGIYYTMKDDVTPSDNGYKVINYIRKKGFGHNEVYAILTALYHSVLMNKIERKYLYPSVNEITEILRNADTSLLEDFLSYVSKLTGKTIKEVVSPINYTLLGLVAIGVIYIYIVNKKK